MSRIPSKDFSNDRNVLILQIRWLLNEMEYTHNLIDNDPYLAKFTLSEQFENNFWLNIGKKSPPSSPPPSIMKG